MKYAFDTVEDPRITLRVNKDKDKMVVSYSDNGSGYDKELPDKHQNFGFQLMDMLVQQLNGTLKIDSTHGMKIVLEF
jgi:two-component sensor histidine kinase